MIPILMMLFIHPSEQPTALPDSLLGVWKVSRQTLNDENHDNAVVAKNARHYIIVRQDRIEQLRYEPTGRVSLDSREILEHHSSDGKHTCTLHHWKPNAVQNTIRFRRAGKDPATVTAVEIFHHSAGGSIEVTWDLIRPKRVEFTRVKSALRKKRRPL